MQSFKQFLKESGNATAAYKTSRATADDIHHALKFVSKTLSIDIETLKQDLLGSTELTLLGKKKDSGDIDIAMSSTDFDPSKVNDLMLKATSNEGAYNAGTKVGSYAVPVVGKKVQVDLMFVPNKKWAKFSYHSALGRGSKYPGAVRNIILLTALAHTQEEGKDFALRDEEGKVIARASKSVKLDSGMERLFKAAKKNAKTGKFNKTIETVDPKQLEQILKDLGKDIKFSHDKDHTDKPDDVAAFIFGSKVKAADIMTAEDVIAHIKKLPNASKIISAAKSELTRLKLEIPEEL